MSKYELFPARYELFPAKYELFPARWYELFPARYERFPARYELSRQYEKMSIYYLPLCELCIVNEGV